MLFRSGELNDYDRETLKEFADVKEEVEKLLDVFKFRDAQKEAMNLARIGNKYLADTEPWKLAKTDMPRVATILNISLQLVANLAIAFEPFLPFSSERLRKMLNMDSFDWAELGHTDLLPAGHQLATPELLFEKIEDDVIQAQVDKLLATKKANAVSYTHLRVLMASCFTTPISQPERSHACSHFRVSVSIAFFQFL